MSTGALHFPFFQSQTFCIQSGWFMRISMRLLLLFCFFTSSIASADPCVPGQVLGEIVSQYGEKTAPRLLEAAKYAPDITETTAKILRSTPGVAKTSRALFDSKVFLRGTEKSAGLTPLDIGRALEGMSFSSFDDYRKAYWKAVASSKYVREFSEESLARMSTGKSSFVVKQQQLGQRRVYELHHITPINQGGSVYDSSNIMVVSPRFHKEVLNVDFHYGAG